MRRAPVKVCAGRVLLPYRGTSLIRKRTPLGPYLRTIPARQCRCALVCRAPFRVCECGVLLLSADRILGEVVPIVPDPDPVPRRVRLLSENIGLETSLLEENWFDSNLLDNEIYCTKNI